MNTPTVNAAAPAVSPSVRLLAGFAFVALIGITLAAAMPSVRLK